MTAASLCTRRWLCLLFCHLSCDYELSGPIRYGYRAWELCGSLHCCRGGCVCKEYADLTWDALRLSRALSTSIACSLFSSRLMSEFVLQSNGPSGGDWFVTSLSFVLISMSLELWWILQPMLSLSSVCMPTLLSIWISRSVKSSRHVKRRLKSVRKLKNSGVIALDYIQTSKNLADPFTKGLSRNVIDSASREMGLRPTDELTTVVNHSM